MACRTAAKSKKCLHWSLPDQALPALFRKVFFYCFQKHLFQKLVVAMKVPKEDNNMQYYSI
jgi:hypothetical protein